MTEYGRIHTDGSRSGGQPTVATQKAHTMVLEVLAEWGLGPRSVTPQQLAVATTEALCRAIDQLEDLRQPTRVMTLEGVEAETQKLVAEASTQSGMTISEWVSARLKSAALQALPSSTQSDALQAENEALRHDLERQMAIANEHVNEVDTLLREIETLRVEALAERLRGYYEGCANPIVRYDALREALERIAKLKWDTMTQGCNAACEASKIARAALEQGK